jgi:hypothetical protein
MPNEINKIINQFNTISIFNNKLAALPVNLILVVIIAISIYLHY